MRAFLLLLSMLFSITALAESANAVMQSVPPVLIGIARCEVVPEDPGKGKVSFDIYVDVTAMDQNSLQDVPGAIALTGFPLPQMKMLFTSTRVSLSALDVQPIKLKASVNEDEDNDDAIILNADIFETDGSFTGSGEVELSSRGTAPVKCKLGDLRSEALRGYTHRK